MKSQFDSSAVLSVFERLHEYVSADPALIELRGSTAALLTQARQLALGNFDIETLGNLHSMQQLPTRESARNILSIMASLPALNDTAPRSLVAAYAALLAGLSENITSLVYRGFPDLVPRR